MTIKEQLIQEVKTLTEEEAARFLGTLHAQKTRTITSEERSARVRAGLGKFAFVRTSSEEFDRRQGEEIAREEAREQRWHSGAPHSGPGDRA